MQSQEPCLVCGTLTNLTCGGCDLRYYCNEECQVKDRNYHLAECQSGQIGAFWGIGKWKSVVSEHASLLMGIIDNIIMFTVRQAGRGLQSNLEDWSKGRGASTRELQRHVSNFNEDIKAYAKALRDNDNTGAISAKTSVKSRASTLASFFSGEGSFGTVFSSRRDYESAFSAYAQCLLDYAVAVDQRKDLDRPDTTEARKSQIPDADRLLAERRRNCDRTADALGAVLNGRPWRTPL
jgi:hypothetical protein